MPIFQNTSFYTTVNRLRDLPFPSGVEIAFAGRSNAGKSSAINSLTNRDRLAFVSKTPGRTQHINFFQLQNGHFLVDLPGYGYAKVPAEIRLHWENLVSTYLQTREALYGMLLVMDARHPFTRLDGQMLGWFGSTKKPVHILLTKSDKLGRQQAAKILVDARRVLRENYPLCSAQLFSSRTKEGVDEAFALLSRWLELGGIGQDEPPIKNPRLKGNKTGGKLP